MKPHKNEMSSATPGSVPGILAACFLFAAGLFLAACQQRVENANVRYPTAGYVGNYTLAAVDGAKVPATVSHGGVSMIVHSGTFKINADGTCRSKIIFSPQSGGDVSRVANATYTRNGSELKMRWEGAGNTTGTIEGGTFTMYNEGMVFVYKMRQEGAGQTTRTIEDDTFTSTTMDQKTLEVSSRMGWQTLVFKKPVVRISGVTGSWSVDDNEHKRVGPEGHRGKSASILSRWDYYKFDKQYPFGALLVEIDGDDYVPVTGPMEFKKPVRSIRARINDADSALGDNGGSLLISFE